MREIDLILKKITSAPQTPLQ